MTSVLWCMVRLPSGLLKSPRTSCFSAHWEFVGFVHNFQTFGLGQFGERAKILSCISQSGVGRHSFRRHDDRGIHCVAGRLGRTLEHCQKQD